MLRVTQSHPLLEICRTYRTVSFQTQVEINTNLLLRDEEYFERADEFLPERWMREESARWRVKDPFAMLPFSHGSRMCIGQSPSSKTSIFLLTLESVQIVGRRLAEQEMCTHILKLVQAFRLTTNDKRAMTQEYVMLFRPSFDPDIRYERRTE